jgi:pyruvate/2-oxoglutarate dehydrogenase complex dihydrolipoamide acyltransferase (E2) component
LTSCFPTSVRALTRPRSSPGESSPATGLDLTSITGTGPAGLVRRKDVRQAIAELAAPRPPAAAGPQAEPAERRIPLSGARRAAADKLSRSRREIPEATVWVDVDATALTEARRAMNAADPARPVSLLALAFDHRACGTAGGFLRYVADCIESPVTALGDM